jgi:hypothetical protein
LKNKSDACDALKRFMAYVERRSGYTLKTLRTDRRTKYILCDDSLRKHGVKHQMTARYTTKPTWHGVKHHYIRDLIKDKEIVVEYCTSEDQIADIFTKPLKTNLFLKMKNMLGMIEPSLREGVR